MQVAAKPSEPRSFTVIMDKDFLDGIDEHFERLMESHGSGRQNGSRNGNRNGNRNARPSDRTVSEIIEDLEDLSRSQKREVLAFIQSLKEKAD